MVLVIKHIGIEGPGTIERFFKKRNLGFRVIELGSAEELPADLSSVTAVLVLGGPMNVYEEDRHPFLKAENLFLKEILKKEIPLLGICLGAQLIAKACGAKVTKAPVKEIGWSKVSLTKEGRNDALFEGLDDELDVFQWHEDTFDVPSHGTLLTTSKDCPYQGFKVGPCAYGLQFHVEVTEEIIRDWTKEYFEKDNKVLEAKAGEILSGYRAIKARYDKQAGVLYDNFFKDVFVRQRLKANNDTYCPRTN